MQQVSKYLNNFIDKLKKKKKEKKTILFEMIIK